MKKQLKDTEKKALILLVILMIAGLITDILTSNESYYKLIAFSTLLTSPLLLFLYPTIINKMQKESIYVKTAFVIVSALLSGIGINSLYCLIEGSLIFAADSLVRILLFSLVMAVANCYVMLDINDVTDFIYRKRWFIAIGVLLIFVALKLNFSNAACFNYYIQPDIQTDFSTPVLGIPRDIRSDEWLVDTPRRAAAAYSGYSKYNFICRGAMNYSISSSYLYLSYSALYNVFNIGYFVLGTEYGASFYWSALFIIGFMISFEFCRLIAFKNNKVALLGASILSLSSFSLWWSMNTQLIAVQALIVCSYYFFNCTVLYKQILYSIGVALSGAMFVCLMYPAWQVPCAYILLALFAWVIIDNFDKIKAMNYKNWINIACAFVFMCSIILVYLYDTSYANEVMLNTVYPGARFDAGGDGFFKGSWYVQTLLYPFKNTGNNSEAGTFFNLFPLPIILSLITLSLQLYRKFRYKDSKIDLLNALLLLPTVLITVYCTVGFPEWLAKISLFSYSLPIRAIDFLGLICVYLLIRLLSYSDEQRKLPIAVGIVTAVALVCYNITTTEKNYPTYMPGAYIAFITTIIVAFVVVLLCKTAPRTKNGIISLVTSVIIISGISVLPITRGFDSLLHKPASLAVQSIVAEDPDSKWIGYDSIVTPQFLIANGAPTINSVNYIPNMELWHLLDPTGQYNEVYNRYSHVSCNFIEGETSFTLIQADCMLLSISYSDLHKTDVKYIFSQYGLSESSDLLDFNLIYNESNVFIYEIVYK